MNFEVRSTSLRTLAGTLIDRIHCCSYLGYTLYLGIWGLGAILYQVKLDGTLQFLSILSLPGIQMIYDYGSEILLDAGDQVCLWGGRKRRINSLFKKEGTDCIQNYKKWIFVGKIYGRRVEVYSNTGRLLSSFKTQGRPFRIFINALLIVVYEGFYETRVYSNDGYFSLITTLRYRAWFLDEHYLYCSDRRGENSKEDFIISLISIESLEVAGYAVVNEFINILGAVALGSDRILVKTQSFYLLEFKNGNNGRMKELWKFGTRDDWSVSDSLWALDSSDPMQYYFLEVLPKMVRTIRISD